jgi:hypothetical protein
MKIVFYFSPIKKLLTIFLFLAGPLAAQLPALKQGEKLPYVRKEEIIFNDKRYRIHNNYLSFGPGYLSSDLRNNVQKNIGIDFQFHIRWQQFQGGLMMSGEEFNSNNHIGAHLGYGFRKESKKKNYAAFIGPSYHNGVFTVKDSLNNIQPDYYNGFGLYACMQAVIKLSYDFGIGGELFTDISAKQRMVGIRFIAFFSGAYVGAKKTVNPNVRLSPAP